MNITSQGDWVLASPRVYGSGHMDKVQVPQQISLTLYLSSKFMFSWHSYQPRWLKHGMCNGWDTFRENQASGERVLDQPTHTVYSSMLMLMRYTKSFIINVHSAIHSAHLQASPSSRLESSMSSQSMYCCHWGPGGGGKWTACHFELAIGNNIVLSAWPLSCSVLVM